MREPSASQFSEPLKAEDPAAETVAQIADRLFDLKRRSDEAQHRGDLVEAHRLLREAAALARLLEGSDK